MYVGLSVGAARVAIMGRSGTGRIPKARLLTMRRDGRRGGRMRDKLPDSGAKGKMNFRRSAAEAAKLLIERKVKRAGCCTLRSPR